MYKLFFIGCILLINDVIFCVFVIIIFFVLFLFKNEKYFNILLVVWKCIGGNECWFNGLVLFCELIKILWYIVFLGFK